jgi:hypothetical protein
VRKFRYQAVELLTGHDPDAVRIACQLVGEGATEDPTQSKEPMNEDELKKFIRPENVKLSDRKENEKFFQRDANGKSKFREFYNYYEGQWPDTSFLTGDRDFNRADGSQLFLRSR